MAKPIQWRFVFRKAAAVCIILGSLSFLGLGVLTTVDNAALLALVTVLLEGAAYVTLSLIGLVLLLWAILELWPVREREGEDAS